MGNRGLQGASLWGPLFFVYSGKIMKEFYTYEQQVKKLKKDGLIILDEQNATDFLKHEGYYNLINGYSPIFKDKKTNKFFNQTTLDDIRHLYIFDKNLRNMVYKYIASIECNIKAIIGHEFSRVHGVDEKQYLTPSSFNQNQSCAIGVSRLIVECNETIQEALKKNSNKYRKYIEHNYIAHGHVPLWVLIRALSFGTTSIFYKYMIDSEKEIIASNYHVNASQLENILEVIVSFRNIVAHGERTYCAKLPRTRLSTNLNISKKLSIPLNEKGEYKYDRNDLLSLIIGCKYLLPDIEFINFITELDLNLQALAKQLTPYMLNRIKIQMGLWADNWKTLPKFKID